MIIAEHLDVPVSKVTVTLANARPELVFNQLTGGSNTTRSTYQAISDAATLAKAKLVEAAAAKWGVDASTLTTKRRLGARARAGAVRATANSPARRRRLEADPPFR